MTHKQIETFANMLEAGVARLRDPELTLAQKQRTAEVMRGLSNRLSEIIKDQIDELDTLAMVAPLP